MSIYELPPNANIKAWMKPLPLQEDLKLFFDRLLAWCTQQGFTVGPRGLGFGTFGTVVMDLDRDPSLAWDTFDPAVKATEETSMDTRLQRAQEVLDRLKSGGAAVTAVERRELDIASLTHLLRVYKRDGAL